MLQANYMQYQITFQKFMQSMKNIRLRNGEKRNILCS